MKYRNKIIAIIVVLFFSSSFLLAQEKDQNDAPSMRRMGMNFTKDQQTKMQDLRLQLEKEILPLRADLQKYRTDLKILQTTDNLDESKVENTLDKISDLQKQIQLKKIKNRNKVRNLLTPEQKTKFDMHLLAKGHERMGEMHHPPMRPERPERPNRPEFRHQMMQDKNQE